MAGCIIVGLLLWATGISGAAWIYLTLGHGWFWRADPRLAPLGAREVPEASVVVVVPARDEAGVLAETLPSLLAQEYPGPARVLLVDDDSSDGTGALALRLGAEGGLPLEVTSPGPPPPGWTGKLWALRHGVEKAGDVEFLLFTDADIAHGPGSLARLVAEATGDCEGEGRLDLVSVMARLRTDTRWERLIVPAFVYFFGKLFPFRRVNRHGSRTAAAAGGCVLVRRTALEQAGGVAAIRESVIDDVALGTAVKRRGGRIRLVLADPVVRQVDSVRPYPELGDLWRMVARSAFAQLRHSWPLLAGTVVGLALVYLTAPAAVIAGALTADPVLLVSGALVWALMAATYIPMIRYHGRNPAAALLLPFAATLYLGMTVDSALRHARGRGAAWKGRTYPAPTDGVAPEHPDRRN